MTGEIHIPPTPEEIAVRLDRLERLTFDRSPALGADEPDPTRTNVIKTHRSGETIEMEWDSIHSVEITSTTKEGPRVSKVKLYGTDPISVAEDAAILFIEASRQLARYIGIEEAIIQDETDEANTEADTSSDTVGNQTDG